MVKIYYGNDYKEAMYGSPLYTNDAKQIASMQKVYNFVTVEDITYEDIQYMTDKQRINLYKDDTGETITEINNEFWDWAEENYENNL